MPECQEEKRPTSRPAWGCQLGPRTEKPQGFSPYFKRSRHRKMASAWRVISFFLVVFVLPTVLISLPLYARYHLYHARHLPMTETDTRALNHAVSSFWCQGQRVTSNGTLDAFLVAGSPRVQRKRRHVSLKRNLTLRHDDIEYWGVYLLEGSKFSLSSCARWAGGTLLVVKGEDNLRKCFYREDRVKEELMKAGLPRVPNVYKGPPDNEEEADKEQQKKKMKYAALEEDEGGVGGEVFEDEQDIFTALKSESQKTVVEKEEDGDDDDNDDDLVPLLVDEVKMHKYDDLVEKKVRPKQKGEKRKNRKGKKNKERKEKQNGSKGSLLVERVRRNVLLDNAAIHPEHSVSGSGVVDKLDMLHKFNDTLDVTTGNSSISSSEEFLEQCKDTILTVDLTPYLDWPIRVLNLKSDNPDAWNFTVNATDYYYFIFTSDNNIEINQLGFHLELERAMYDVSAPIDTCRNSSECVFPLAFTQTESVVVEVPAEGNLSELHSYEVTTTCQPRVPVYMVFILLVPFIILIFAFQ
ncbi:uncharacterized protein [Macrobrachium rosenbergii]|uniref:uncharacterized protein isoform X3 n=1 Tax=Macrobrachium rosenbergii TaxID=79674 RepID=UPI0034D5EF60